MGKYLYSPISFHLNNGAQMLAPITSDGRWVVRSTGPIYASSTAKLTELVANKSTGLVTVEQAIGTVFGGFAGWATARPAAAPKAPVAKPSATPAPTPFMDKARRAAGSQAKAKAADAPRSVGNTRHWLNLSLDYANATLQGDMGGDLAKRGKAARTAYASYVESCSHYGQTPDPAYEEAVGTLSAAIAKRLAAG